MYWHLVERMCKQQYFLSSYSAEMDDFDMTYWSFTNALEM